MPKRRPVTLLLDQTIDDRLDQLAVLRFGQPHATQDLRCECIALNPVQRFPIIEAAQELAAVIRDQGVMSPLWVRPHPDKMRWWQLLYGPHRHLATSFTAFGRIPCVIVDADDATLDEFGLMEALQRMPFPLLEEAHVLRWLLDTRGYTIRSLAESIGRKKGYLENRLALLHLPADVQQLVVAQSEMLSAALQLAKIVDPERRAELLTGVGDGVLTVATIRAEAQALRRPKGGRRKAEGGKEYQDALPDESAVQRILMRWKALRQDEIARPNVDAALARTLALITAIGEVP